MSERLAYDADANTTAYLDREKTARACMRRQPKCNVLCGPCCCVFCPREAVIDVFVGIRIDFVIIVDKLFGELVHINREKNMLCLHMG